MPSISVAALKKETGRHYGLNITAIKPWGAVWRVVTRDGVFILKPSGDATATGARAALEHLAAELRLLVQNGFPEIPLPLRSGTGASSLELAGRLYILLPFVHGANPSFTNAKHLERTAALYARLHRVSQQTVPERSEPLLSCIAELTDRTELMTASLRELADLPQPNRIDRAALRWGDYFLEQAATALRGLEATVKRAAAVAAPAGFCHNDPAPRNIIMQDQKWFLIDFALAGRNLYVRELATLVNRVAAANLWQPEVAARLVATYSQNRTLTLLEQDLLPYFLWFPQKFWRFCSQRYREKLERGAHYYQEKIRTLTQEEPLRRKMLQTITPQQQIGLFSQRSNQLPTADPAEKTEEEYDE